MPTGKPIDLATKAEIIRKIRDEGMKVVDASEQYGIGSPTIYRWLKEGVVDGNRNLILENNKLRKELEIAYRLLGRAAAEMNRPKR